MSAEKMMNIEKEWMVYILECSDSTLYTGITDDLDRRIEMHNAGKGAKYTRGRGPVKVLFSEKCDDYGAALRRESQIKRLTREQKLALCYQNTEECEQYAIFSGHN